MRETIKLRQACKRCKLSFAHEAKSRASQPVCVKSVNTNRQLNIVGMRAVRRLLLRRRH